MFSWFKTKTKAPTESSGGIYKSQQMYYCCNTENGEKDYMHVETYCNGVASFTSAYAEPKEDFNGVAIYLHPDDVERLYEQLGAILGKGE